MKVKAKQTLAFIIRKGDIYTVYGTDANHFLIYGDDKKWRWIEIANFIPANQILD